MRLGLSRISSTNLPGLVEDRSTGTLVPTGQTADDREGELFGEVEDRTASYTSDV